MRIGIGLPTVLAPTPDRRMLLDWAREAEECGFTTLAVLDKPRYDGWDPLLALAAAATVTDWPRLQTGILQLPNRPTRLVAQQAAALDVLSAGRLDLGVALGARPDDYAYFDSRFDHRAARFERQLHELREHWREAQHGQAPMGMRPVQQPHPPLLIGAMAPAALIRAARLGDGVIFAAIGAAEMARHLSGLREIAAESGRMGFRVIGQAWVALGADGLDSARYQLTRYFGTLFDDPINFVHHGTPDRLAEALAQYAAAGLDELVLLPLVPRLDQIGACTEAVAAAGVTAGENDVR